MSILSKILPNFLLKHFDLKPNPLPRFPLLKLPLVAIECILTSMEMGDLIHLSLSSERSHRLISQLKKKKCKIVMSMNGGSVHLKFYAKNYYTFWIFSNIGSKGCRVSGERAFNLVFGRTLRTITDRNLLECAKEWLIYCKILFHYSCNTIIIYTDTIQTFSLNYSDPISYLFIKGTKTIPNRDLMTLLKNFEATKCIELRVPTEETFYSDINEWTSQESICIRNAHWLTDEMLLSSKYHRMAFYNCRISADTCRKFVQKWHVSRDNNFSFLLLKWENNTREELNFDGLGLKLMEFDEKRRKSCYYYYCTSFRLDEGMDFEREDGLLATIQICLDGLIFCVWHDRFPVFKLNNPRWIEHAG